MPSRAGRLADALRRARSRIQTQSEVDEARRNARLVALEQEMDSLASELPALSGGFEDRFALTRSHSGEKLLIDALAYADLNPETEQYRLVRHMRDGPKLLLETAEKEPMANAIADYMAERIVEVEATRKVTQPARGSATFQDQQQGSQPGKAIGVWRALVLFGLGALTALLVLFAYAWVSYPVGG